MNSFDVLRIISFPFRYSIVLGLAKVLTPALFKHILYPLIYSDFRPMIRYIKASQKKQLIGAEIGVFKGHHAVSMLSYLPLKKLYLVDPYRSYVQDGVLINPIAAQRIAIQSLRKFEDRVTWIQSIELPDNLDFIYVDGNHSYKAVKKDMEVYYSKVRKDGVLGGHDFTNQFPGVIKAVAEFTSTKNLELFVEQPDWWIQK